MEAGAALRAAGLAAEARPTRSAAGQPAEVPTVVEDTAEAPIEAADLTARHLPGRDPQPVIPSPDPMEIRIARPPALPDPPLARAHAHFAPALIRRKPRATASGTPSAPHPLRHLYLREISDALRLGEAFPPPVV